MTNSYNTSSGQAAEHPTTHNTDDIIGLDLNMSVPTESTLHNLNNASNTMLFGYNLATPYQEHISTASAVNENTMKENTPAPAVMSLGIPNVKAGPGGATLEETPLQKSLVKGFGSTIQYNGINPEVKFMEKDLLRQLDKEDYELAEEYMSYLLDLKEHLGVLLKIRTLKLLTYLDRKLVTDAKGYLGTHICTEFSGLSSIGQQNLPYVNISYMEKEVKFLRQCVNAKKRLAHFYGTPESVALYIADYMRVHMPLEIEYKHGIDYWRFAFEIPKSNSNSRKKSYRCMVCSIKNFNNYSITELRKHLSICPMAGTPYLQQLMIDSEPKKAAKKTKNATEENPQAANKESQSGDNSSHPQVAGKALFTSELCIGKFLQSVEFARVIHKQMEADLPDSPYPRLIERALDAIETSGMGALAALATPPSAATLSAFQPLIPQEAPRSKKRSNLSVSPSYTEVDEAVPGAPQQKTSSEVPTVATDPEDDDDVHLTLGPSASRHP